MKRFIMMCMCICAISTASACGSSKSAEISLPKSYTVTADISSDDFAGKAQFERLEGGWQISVSEPKTLAGMEISLTDADCKISFEEMEQTFFTRGVARKFADIFDGAGVGKMRCGKSQR